MRAIPPCHRPNLWLAALLCGACQLPLPAEYVDPVARGDWRGEPVGPEVAAACNGLPAVEADFVAVDDDLWAYAGRMGATGHFDAGCGGEGPDLALHFTAPAAGRWQFAYDTRFTQFPTVLHARSACDDPYAEVACGTTQGAFQSAPGGAIVVHLEAGESLTLIADSERWFRCGSAGFGGGCSEVEGDYGPFVLLATRSDDSVAPVIEHASDRLLPNGLHVLRIQAADPNGDLATFEVRPFDAAGQPLLVQEPAELGGQRLIALAPRDSVIGLTRAGVEFTLQLPFTTFDLKVRATDREGLTGAWADVPVETLPPLRPGDACDASLSPDAQCGRANPCRVEGDGVARCMADLPPVVHLARFVRVGTSLAAELSYSDPNGAGILATIELLAAPGGPALPLDAAGTTEIGLRRLAESPDPAIGLDVTLATTERPIVTPAAARHVRLRLQDPSGLVESLEYPLEPAHALGPHERCWDPQQTGPCDAGLACARKDWEEWSPMGHCVGEASPTVDAAHVLVDPAGGLVLVAEGTFAAYVGAGYGDFTALLDADGARLPLPDGSWLGQFSSDRIRVPFAPDAFPTDYRVAAPVVRFDGDGMTPVRIDDFPAVAGVGFTVRDEFYRPVGALALELSPQPARDVGEACDPAGLLDHCSDGAACPAEDARCP